MRYHLSIRFLRGLCLTAVLFATDAHAQNAIFSNGFEPNLPASDAIAARFLTQATFGPSRPMIANVRSIGFDAWITAQMATQATLARPYLQGQATQGLATNQPQRLNRWFHTAATAPDQLRQRVAFALSEIMVVSDGPDNLANDWPGIAEYQDMLAARL